MMNRIFALRNNTIEDSSSGGAFPTILHAIEKKYESNGFIMVVYGVILDEQLNAIYERFEKREEFRQFRGSKYVKANPAVVFPLVEKDLKDGKVVVFSGIPCQVDSLLKLLQKNKIKMELLYTIDLICHGAPPKKYFADYKEWIEKKQKSQLVDFSFRYQKTRWKSYPVKAVFSNKKTKINTFQIRQYIELFSTGLLLSEGCYHCKYSNLNRVSDITIGDFWGIDYVMPEYPYHDSVSELIVNTNKGNDIIDRIVDYSNQGKNVEIVVSECKNDAFIKFQHNLNKPTFRPELKDKFDLDYESKGFEYAIKKYGAYNIKGFIKHCISKFRAETGMNDLIRKLKGLRNKRMV